jgi:hypothetical protein
MLTSRRNSVLPAKLNNQAPPVGGVVVEMEKAS